MEKSEKIDRFKKGNSFSEFEFEKPLFENIEKNFLGTFFNEFPVKEKNENFGRKNNFEKTNEIFSEKKQYFQNEEKFKDGKIYDF